MHFTEAKNLSENSETERNTKSQATKIHLDSSGLSLHVCVT